jgi:hypothetical protein
VSHSDDPHVGRLKQATGGQVLKATKDKRWVSADDGEDRLGRREALNVG